MKRVLALVLALVFVLGLATVSFAEGKVSSHSMTYGVAEAEAEAARIRKEDE